MKLSIVATLYKSAPYIEEFYQRTTTVARQLVSDDYEIILVNDGSPDNSLELAARLTQIDSHVTIIDLSRNFGHHLAIMTGLKHTCGRQIFLIDSDLEEEPEWLLGFASKMAQDDCDVVYGVQEKRRENGFFERLSGKLFYRMFRLLTSLDLPNDIVVARLMSHRYVSALLQHEEREVFIAGLWVVTGFDQRAITVTKHSTSKSTYTLRRKLSHLVNSVTSFSNVPLIGIFLVGCALSFFAGIYVMYLFINWIFFASPPSGWTSVMASIWLLGGLLILFIGIIGIYLSKIFTETKRRPSTIIRQIYGKQQ